MGRWRRALAGAAGVLGAGALATMAATRTFLWFPDEEEPVRVSCQGTLEPLPRGESISVLVWNIQFSAGRDHLFFYDGGDAVSVSRETVEHTLAGIAAVLREADADVVLLQEVDRGSRRTDHTDQHEGLLGQVAYPCHVSTPYHQVGYVPFPAHEHLGKVDMHLSVFSRYEIGQATRYQLPLLDESVVRRVFNLRRALLELRFPLAGGGDAVMFDTHLSAFSRGDGTLGKQIEVLDARVREVEQAGMPWILAGDLNALPPGDAPARLGDDAELYAEAETPLGLMFDHWTSVISEAEYRDHPEEWRTYVPYGAQLPDRTLDYAFVGTGVTIESVSVLKTAIAWSDHLPILIQLRFD